MSENHMDRYDEVILCIIKHAKQIYHGNYDNSEELFNYTDERIFAKNIAHLAEAFGMMAVKLEARELHLHKTIENLIMKEQELRNLWDGFLRSLMVTIDARDPATAGHSLRTAEYAARLAVAVGKANYGVYKDVAFTDEQVNEIYYAALLHDIGKIGVSESVLLKKKRLSPDRMQLLYYKIAFLNSMLENKKLTKTITPEEEDVLRQLPTYYQHIVSCNEKNSLTAEDEKKLTEIKKIVLTGPDGTPTRLLDDGEAENLSVITGTLTGKERDAIRMHAVYTYDILNQIPWSANLQNVAIIAAHHHERSDGSGYPRACKQDTIPLPSRILAIADVFEALTAPDRPYKSTMTVQDALEILRRQAESGLLDIDLFDIWEKEKLSTG